MARGEYRRGKSGPVLCRQGPQEDVKTAELSEGQGSLRERFA